MMFYREEKKATSIKTPHPLKNMELIETKEKLLKDKKRQGIIAQIKEKIGFQSTDYQKMVTPLIENVAVYCQHLPETSLYFGYRGGLLDRVLSRTEAALSLMRQLMVQGDTAPPSEEQKVWLYAIFSAGLLQGIGKLFTEYQISLFDNMGKSIKLWEPLLEGMQDTGVYYNYQLQADEDQQRKRVTLLLAQRLMPKEGFAFLASYPAIFYAWLALLEEDRDGAGSLDAILDRANALSLQKYLTDYLEENRHLIEYGAGKIGGFLDSNPDSLLQREQVIGAEFLLWIRDGLSEGKFLLNKPPIRAEIFPNGVVLDPEVYDMFMQDHLKIKNKYIIQRAVHAWNQPQVKDSAPQTEKQPLTKLTLDNAILPETVKVYSSKTEHIATVRTLDLVHDRQSYLLGYEKSPAIIQQLDLNGSWTAQQQQAPQTKIGRSGG